MHRRGRVVAFTLGLSILWLDHRRPGPDDRISRRGQPTDPVSGGPFLSVLLPSRLRRDRDVHAGEVRRLTTASWLDGIVAGLGRVGGVFRFRLPLDRARHRWRCPGYGHQSRLSDRGRAAPGHWSSADRHPLGKAQGPVDPLAVGIECPMSSGTRSPSSVTSWMSDTAQAIAVAISISSHRHGPVATAPAGGPSGAAEGAGFFLPNLALPLPSPILFIGSLRHVSAVTVGLATATLATVGLRLVLSVRDMRTLSQERTGNRSPTISPVWEHRRHLFRVLDASLRRSRGDRTHRTGLALSLRRSHSFKEVNDSRSSGRDELLTQLVCTAPGALPQLRPARPDRRRRVRRRPHRRRCRLRRLRRPIALTAKSRGTFRPRRGDGASIQRQHAGSPTAPTDARDSADWCGAADVAMYRAKLGSYPLLSTPRPRRRGDRLQLVEDLRVAIDEGQLVLHYQAAA